MQTTKLRSSIFYFLISFVIVCNSLPILQDDIPNNTSYISYKLAGRVGDNILVYCKAKWLAYKYGIPLLYKPFKYSQELILDSNEQKYIRSLVGHLKVVPIKNEYIVLRPQSSCLYESDFFFSPLDWTHDEVVIKDLLFLNQLKKLVSPKKKLPKLLLPSNMVTVAMHVRRGGGYDSQLLMSSNVLKFPPDSFYIESIQKMYLLNDSKPMYVYIFTDDANPNAIAYAYQAKINNPNIFFDCRQGSNSHDAHVLEDLFKITQFDCLIRPRSSYSMSAQILGNFKKVIFPKHALWQLGSFDIDTVGLIDHGDISYFHSL